MKSHYFFSAASLAGFSFIFPQALFAQASAPELNPVVVTADRVATTEDETLASVSVITRADIEREQVVSVPDALRGLPGISFANNGGLGKQTSLFMRGTNSDHVLVLVDGIKVGSATSGAAALQNIPIDQVDRIEVVRGPRASLYGSEAIGGVIQIFTRKGEGAGLVPSFSLGGGSRSSYDGTFNLSGSNVENGKGGWFNIGVTGETTRGINACGNNLNAGCFTNEPDRDGYRDASVSLRGGYNYSSNLSADVQWLQTYYHNDYDGTMENESIGRQQVLGVTLRYKPVSAWQSTLRVGRSIDDATNYHDDTYSSRFKTTLTTTSWQNDISVGSNHLFTLGLDGQNDKVASDTNYDKTSRNNAAIFGQYLGNFDKADVQLSLREDDNEQFGYYGTGSGALGYTFSSNLRLTASYGTAFKAPTFNQLYYPYYGNPDLQPEKSESYEVGMSGQHNWSGKWQVSVYQTDITNLIANNSSWMLANIAQAQIRGIEGTFTWKMWGIDLSAYVTFIDPVDRSGGANDGNQLPRRPRQSARLDVDRDFGQWSVGGSLMAQGKSYDDPGNTVKLGGFGTMDLRAEYKFNKSWRLQARIENLFDKRYQTAYMYNQVGFGAFATLRYQLQ